ETGALRAHDGPARLPPPSSPFRDDERHTRIVTSVDRGASATAPSVPPHRGATPPTRPSEKETSMRNTTTTPAPSRVWPPVLVTMLLLALATPVHARQSATVFRDARVFDGEAVHERTDVLVENGRIARIGPRLEAPAGAVVVDAAGKTLLPGLIDAHTHTFGDGLQQAIIFGVTTHLDMFTDHRLVRQLRDEQEAGNVAERADIFSAGTLVTAPGGHGT